LLIILYSFIFNPSTTPGTVVVLFFISLSFGFLLAYVSTKLI
jgi:hypothetical protein